jgi:hypothetical protein
VRSLRVLVARRIQAGLPRASASRSTAKDDHLGFERSDSRRYNEHEFYKLRRGGEGPNGRPHLTCSSFAPRPTGDAKQITKRRSGTTSDPGHGPYEHGPRVLCSSVSGPRYQGLDWDGRNADVDVVPVTGWRAESRIFRPFGKRTTIRRVVPTGRTHDDRSSYEHACPNGRPSEGSTMAPAAPAGVARRAWPPGGHDTTAPEGCGWADGRAGPDPFRGPAPRGAERQPRTGATADSKQIRPRHHPRPPLRAASPWT